MLKTQQFMNKEFIRVRSVKDVLISTSMTILGSILLILPTSDSINILGFFMIFTGIILFLTLRSSYKDTETGLIYSKKEHFFAQSIRQELLDTLTSMPSSISLSEEDKGNGIRLDIYHSKATGKAYIQMFEYVPYKYEPCSKVLEYNLSDVVKLVK